MSQQEHKPSGRRQNEEPAVAPLYRSGAAARLAGLPVETLRVWERRYKVIGPRVSARGRRLYSAEQVRRLGLIKQLVDLGNPISALAPLSDETLSDMQATARALLPAPPNATVATPQTIRTVLVGEVFAARLAAEMRRDTWLDIVATCADVARSLQVLAGTRADLVVIELPSLMQEAVAVLDRLRERVGASAAVVLYRFGQRETIQRLRSQGCVVSRMPLDAAEVETLCRAAFAARPQSLPADAEGKSPAAPRFDESALEAITLGSGTPGGERAKRLAELLRALMSFERFSAQGEPRDPAELALHRELARAAGEARVKFEDALIRIAPTGALPPRARAVGKT